MDGLLEVEGVRAERFTARHDGDSLGLVRRAWDVEGLARAYSRWHADAEELVSAAGRDPGDEQAFAARSPGWCTSGASSCSSTPACRASCCPGDWPGDQAADFFDAESERLLPAAVRFVDACLTSPA